MGDDRKPTGGHESGTKSNVMNSRQAITNPKMLNFGGATRTCEDLTGRRHCSQTSFPQGTELVQLYEALGEGWDSSNGSVSVEGKEHPFFFHQ